VLLRVVGDGFFLVLLKILDYESVVGTLRDALICLYIKKIMVIRSTAKW